MNHLGNVRIGVVDESSAITFDASMEADKAEEEEQYFMHMASRYMDQVFNHTAVGSYSSKLNPMDANHAYTIGPAINLEVSPGDTVKMEVFAQYMTPINDVNDVVAAMASTIAGSFGFVSPVGESASLVGAFAEALTAGAAVPNIDRQGAPKGYIQYIVFNKNMTMAQHGYQMVTDEAMANWQKLELEVPIEENGYIYIYIANESNENVDVYFDDKEVQLIDAPVTTASDYYPFGLAMAGRSYSSENYRFGYQGQFAELDEETGWNSFEARMYEPVIGRWMMPDPMRQYWSPYLSMRNNPLIIVDPDGRFDEPKNGFQRAWNTLTFRCSLNKHYAIKVHRVLTPSEMKQFNEMQAAGIWNNGNSFDARGEFRKFGFFPSPPNGSGFEANFFIGLGVKVAVDRIEDAAGGNDLYLTIGGGAGADISAEGHANYYENGFIPEPQNIVGLNYFWGGGYGIASFERSSTILKDNGLYYFGTYNLQSPGYSVGTPYLIGGGKVGLSYTINLSDVARTIQGYQTRSYHE